jgi:hypothetical protein
LLVEHLEFAHAIPRVLVCVEQLSE